MDELGTMGMGRNWSGGYGWIGFADGRGWDDNDVDDADDDDDDDRNWWMFTLGFRRMVIIISLKEW